MKDIFVARQPIFDRNQRVVAYELLYRSDARTQVAGDLSDQKMTSSVLVNSVLGMGLGKLTEGQVAFINVSEDMLFDGTVELLDPGRVIVELLETVRPTAEVVARSRELVDAGYSLALDDFEYDQSFHPLIELAEIVKVDVMASGHDIDDVVERLGAYDVRLLAEKVESQEEHKRCVELGFELFQGYHYFKPQTVTTRESATQSVSIIRLMNMLRDQTASDRHLEEAFKSDPGLTYKLLRIVNSAAVGGRGIQSIQHALRLLGRDPLYRWLCLLLVSRGRDIGDMRTEIIKAALLRARMCEILGSSLRGVARREMPSAGALFLVGLFAQIDQLVGTPIPEVLEEIDVTDEVRDALLERRGHAGRILASAEAYAAADWKSAEREIREVGGNPDILPGVYLDAVTWASQRVLNAN